MSELNLHLLLQLNFLLLLLLNAYKTLFIKIKFSRPRNMTDVFISPWSLIQDPVIGRAPTQTVASPGNPPSTSQTPRIWSTILI